MKITDLEIDGYGVWSGLSLQRLAEGLNVLYGPNEAGKTTLLQFVRSMLYGFSPERRRYFPPVRGGRPGGSIDLAGPNGRFRLDRHADDADGGQPGDREQLTLTAADGTRQGEHLLSALLSQLDEAIYNNIFAVGLREMQELGTLGDTEAAELLYSLTAGLDRVSLVEVIRELETSRNRILDRAGGPCQVVQLLEQQEKLRLEIEELGNSTRRYGRLAAERDQFHREATRLEEDKNRADYQARVIELAITLHDRWARRAALEDELTALGPAASMPDGVDRAVERLDALNTRLQKHRQRAEQLQRRRDQLRSEAAGLRINEALWRQAARIEALQEQQPWLAALEGQVGELEAEIAELQSGLAAEREQLGLARTSHQPGTSRNSVPLLAAGKQCCENFRENTASGEAVAHRSEKCGLGPHADDSSLPVISPRSLSVLRSPAGVLKQCRRRLSEAKQETATANENAESLSRQIEAALAARGQTDLAEVMDAAGSRVAQFRRRIQLDERLDEMTRYQTELEQQSRRFVDRQLLPLWVLAGLGAVFVLGVVLVMAGLLMPASITGSVGWAMALLGLAGSGAAGFGKVILEHSNVRRLEVCQKQINMLGLQIEQAKQERDTLDQQLPRGGGPIAGRLEAAEKELAALEELGPLDGRRDAAQQEAHAAAGRLNLAESELGAARRRWREALRAIGLPTNLAPKQVRQLVRRCDQIGRMHRRLEDRREELGRRRRELDSLTGRISQIVTDTGLAPAGDQPVEQLRRLGKALGEQEGRISRRDLLIRKTRLLRRKRARHEQAVSRLKLTRRELLREAGARDEQEFRGRALQVARAEVLRRDRDAVAREITAAIGGSCPEQAVREQLEGEASESLEARRDKLLERLAVLEKQLQDRFEKRGQLAEQLKTLAEDKQMALKQLELATLEKRLEEAIARWQVLAVTSRTLEVIRASYEQERQPETLQEASGYLDRLTGGRYHRVWTPLGEDVLRVDDADGNSLPVEVLSRGTREQLFLSLRLALVASYARRGATLPLVLDDVLVNFDADRAKAAAAVLRDFAAAGHQLLVFTCHEHILKLFKSLNVPVSRLPDNAEAEHAPIRFEQPEKKKTSKRKRPTSPPEEPEQPADEILPAEDEPAEDDYEDDETAEAA